MSTRSRRIDSFADRSSLPIREALEDSLLSVRLEDGGEDDIFDLLQSDEEESPRIVGDERYVDDVVRDVSAFYYSAKKADEQEEVAREYGHREDEDAAAMKERLSRIHSELSSVREMLNERQQNLDLYARRLAKREHMLLSFVRILLVNPNDEKRRQSRQVLQLMSPLLPQIVQFAARKNDVDFQQRMMEILYQSVQYHGRSATRYTKDIPAAIYGRPKKQRWEAFFFSKSERVAVPSSLLLLHTSTEHADEALLALQNICTHSERARIHVLQLHGVSTLCKCIRSRRMEHVASAVRVILLLSTTSLSSPNRRRDDDEANFDIQCGTPGCLSAITDSFRNAMATDDTRVIEGLSIIIQRITQKRRKGMIARIEELHLPSLLQEASFKTSSDFVRENVAAALEQLSAL